MNWLREFAKLPEDAGLTMSLITTRTAECEGLESYGEESAYRNRDHRRTCSRYEADVGRSGYGTLWAQDAGVWRAELPCRFAHRVSSRGQEEDPGHRERWHACRTDELGINHEHIGIVELPDDLPEPDFILEIDNKSLTHRPDLWGHFGMAREVAAITGGTLTDPVDLSLLPSGPAVFEVEGDAGTVPAFQLLWFTRT